MNDFGQDMRGGRKRGLGRGLSSLIPEAPVRVERDEPATDGITLVPVEFLRPSTYQPRRQFDEDELNGLAESIKAKGVMQPLLVRAEKGQNGHYEIIAGERRWRAAQRAALHQLPVIIHDLSDRETLEVAILENVQRQDLSPLEEAEGYQRLIDEFGHTQQELAETVGKSRSQITNLLRLLSLPSPIRDMVETGALSAGHARALLGADNPLALAKMIVAKGLNVRQTEALTKNTKSEIEVPTKDSSRDPDIVALERELANQLGLKVALATKGKGGTLSISYGTLDQLDRLLERLR